MVSVRVKVAVVGLILSALVFVLVAPSGAAAVWGLLVLAALSLGRMTIAYVISLFFALGYGYTAATNRRAAVIMLPVLDVLQSVPILAFFPAAILFFVAATNRSPIGLELAVVFLIFTGMSWNMAYAVYEGVQGIPKELEEAATSYGLTGALRLRRITFPAMVPRLSHNSVLSWSNGWFFLVASEIFSTGSETFRLPGLGSYIATNGQQGDIAGLAAGLATLTVVVLLLDIFVWRPVLVWSRKFGYDEKAAPVTKFPLYEKLRWMPTFPAIRRLAGGIVNRAVARFEPVTRRLEGVYTRHRTALRVVRWVDSAMFLAILVLVTAAGLVGLARLFSNPLPAEAREIPLAALLSAGRLTLAYALALAWTVPAAVLIKRNTGLGRYAVPTAEVLASIPATALLPIVVAIAIGVFRSVELAAVVIAMVSMQWYLLFNAISALQGLPSELDDAARSFGLRGWTYWKRILLPVMAPALVTGTITAWGAGWNALIVAEFFPSGGYSVLGLGALLDLATFSAPSSPELILLTVFAMVAVVLAVDKLLWHPLQRRVSVRYRID